MLVPEYIVKKIQMFTLIIDRTIPKNQIQDRFNQLESIITEYLSSMDSGFVSNNSNEFKAYLEERVGKVTFSKNFAVRVRPDSIRLFVEGKEIEDKEL